MATPRKACFIIGMKPARTRSLQKRRRAFMLDLAKLQTQHDQQCQQTNAVTQIFKKSKREHLRAPITAFKLTNDEVCQDGRAM